MRGGAWPGVLQAGLADLPHHPGGWARALVTVHGRTCIYDIIYVYTVIHIYGIIFEDIDVCMYACIDVDM